MKISISSYTDKIRSESERGDKLQSEKAQLVAGFNAKELLAFAVNTKGELHKRP